MGDLLYILGSSSHSSNKSFRQHTKPVTYVATAASFVNKERNRRRRRWWVHTGRSTFSWQKSVSAAKLDFIQARKHRPQRGRAWWYFIEHVHEELGLRTICLTDTAVQLMGVDGGGSTSVHPFGSSKQHQMETGGYKTAVNRCRWPSIVLTSTKVMIVISILRI